MKRNSFKGLLQEFKLNSNKKVVNQNKELIFPEVGKDIIPRSIAFTEKDLKKLSKLRAKYKLSRSAIVRILLNSVEV